jgi:peptidoglycan/xylan/chitin deacetylase (PgdA/CDA1 family)
VIAALESLGYRDVHWHVELEDWEPWTTAASIEEGAVGGALAQGDGAVVLMHTWPGPTAEALPNVLSTLKGAGARFVGVDELEALP